MEHPDHEEESLSMKTYELRDKAIKSENTEYLLGHRDTGRHGCYMIYGLLRPGEKERRVNPGAGHEEILLAVEGNLEVTGCHSGNLKEGSALYLEGQQECFLENRGVSDAVYIIAGGHSEKGHSEA